MSVATGFDVIIKLVSGGTCTCSNDVTSLSGGTCTKVPYLDSYGLNGSIAMLDVSSFGDKISKVVPGMPSATLDFSGGLDLTDPTQLGFWNNLSCSSKIQRMLKAWDGGKKITVKGYLTGQQIGSTPTGKSTFSASLSLTQLPRTC
jgi:hypothetical protein